LDGDDDGDHAITERFKPILSHSECARAQRNFHFTKIATADGNEKINRKTHIPPNLVVEPQHLS
jgi:hypothetical protein